VTAVDEHATRLLRRHGWEPGAVLGQGMEGTVVDLSAEQVAKIWHGRSRADLDALLRFGSALGDSSLPFATPQVLELLVDDDVVITIERKVYGRPLRPDRIPAPPPVGADAARLMGDVLEGLSHVDGASGLAALPILPGDRAFDWPGSFSRSLADLVERRFHALPGLLRREVEDIDVFVPAVATALRALPESDPVALLHGDLIPANVLVQDGCVSGVLDFGFLTTVGDPHFDAAITASIFDMYGPNARASESLLSQAFAARFGHDPARYGLYRAAYAIITNAYFGSDGADGHFAWCAQMLRRPDVRSAVLN
jgi:aminoglycoside phosphotransferase (APT) family kinase protein